LESLGSKLKSTREEKGLTLEFISQETNISSRYLEALENEEFNKFPGEPYLLGFLKNYGTYLELNVNELLSLYRSFKIQEQPVPVDELLISHSKTPAIIGRLMIILAVLGLAAGGVYFFFQQTDKPPEEAPPVHMPQEYTMNTGSMERRFYPGDTILVPAGNNTYRIDLTGLSDTVTLTTPTGPVRLDLSQEATVDLDSEGFKLTITIADFMKNNSSSGALIRLDLQSPIIETPVITVSEPVPASQGTTVILNSPNPYPFTLQASFQGYCLFRWEILFEQDRPGRNEQYFQNSDELSIQAQNGIRIGLSNAQAVRLQVIGGGRTIPIEAGGAGEVVVADVRWLRDEENRFRLVLAHLE